MNSLTRLGDCLAQGKLPVSSQLLRILAAPSARPSASSASLLSARTWPATVQTRSYAKKANNSPPATAKTKKREIPQDPKIQNFLKQIVLTTNPAKAPAPLRMGRNRHLRHWTIHRAWQLHRRNEAAARRRELRRQYQSMWAACEELRNTSGPGLRAEGYLYRVAMEKRGVYGTHAGPPIEYARPQTETPARVAWDHDWKNPA